MDWLAVLEAQGKLIYFHVPNGGKRSKAEAGIMKRLGVRAGVADLALILAPYGQAAFIELKIKPNKPTEMQRQFGAALQEVGGYWAVCYTFDEFRAVVDTWLDEESGKPATNPRAGPARREPLRALMRSP